MRHPIEIDGSHGEGGGQILRSALSLSLMTGLPFRMSRVRAQRAKPGLMRQHLACVVAAQQVSGARVRGAELGSTELEFHPGPLVAGDSFREGPIPFFRMMAFISLNLFILNLLPIPVLDGGHLLLYCIEAIRRRPLSTRVVEIWTTAGFFVLWASC